MPEATAVSLPDDLPATLPPAPQIRPVLVKVTFRRDKGACFMGIDARELHAYLERIGVEKQNNGSFKSPPYSGYRVVDPGNHEIASMALLKPGGPHDFNLLSEYHNIPGSEVLTRIAASVERVVNAIIDHYRPIEISVVIHSKPSAPAAAGGR